MPDSLNTPPAFCYDEMIHELAVRFSVLPRVAANEFTLLDYVEMKCKMAMDSKRKEYFENKAIEKAKKR